MPAPPAEQPPAEQQPAEQPPAERPGWGKGDENHVHTGPPGQSKSDPPGHDKPKDDKPKQ